MDKLASISHFFQATIGKFSISTIDHSILIIAAGVFVAVLVIFTQERTRAAMILIGIYAVAFALSFVPQAKAQFEKAVPKADRMYVEITLGALPVAALIAMKRKKRGAIYSPSRRTHQSRY